MHSRRAPGIWPFEMFHNQFRSGMPVPPGSWAKSLNLSPETLLLGSKKPRNGKQHVHVAMLLEVRWLVLWKWGSCWIFHGFDICEGGV